MGEGGRWCVWGAAADLKNLFLSVRCQRAGDRPRQEGGCLNSTTLIAVLFLRQGLAT